MRQQSTQDRGLYGTPSATPARRPRAGTAQNLLGPAVAAGLLFAAMTPAAFADFIVTSRHSRIAFTSANLSTVGPSPSGEIESFDLAAPFVEQLIGEADSVEPVGYPNHGEWDVWQDSSIFPDHVLCHASQTALTSTNLGTPGLYTDSIFELKFEVDHPTTMYLSGTLVGDTNWPSTNSAEVHVLDGFATTFWTAFGTTLPQTFSLQTGHEYTLYVRAGGSVFYNGSIHSSVNLAMTDISCSPCDTNCDGSVNLFDIDPFVGVLTGEPGCSPCAGDSNYDGSLNLFDIDPFVECLSG